MKLSSLLFVAAIITITGTINAQPSAPSVQQVYIYSGNGDTDKSKQNNADVAKTSQDPSTEETVNYINNKLRENPEDGSFGPWQIKIENGFLIAERTYEAQYENFLYHYGLLVSQVDERFIHTNSENSCNKLKSTIYLECKGDYYNSHSTSTCVTATRFNRQDAKYNLYQDNVYYEIEITFSNKNRICDNLINAFKHLVSKINEQETFNELNNNDPFSLKKQPNRNNSNQASDLLDTANSNIVYMVKEEGGTYEVPVILNGVLKIRFIFDSGSSDISISPDVASTLFKTGTIKQADFIGYQQYKFADGSIATSKTFMLHEIKIGNKIIKNVKASISNSIDAPMLLGQSLLQKFAKFSIDNNNHTLTIE